MNFNEDERESATTDDRAHFRALPSVVSWSVYSPMQQADCSGIAFPDSKAAQDEVDRRQEQEGAAQNVARFHSLPSVVSWSVHRGGASSGAEHDESQARAMNHVDQFLALPSVASWFVHMPSGRRTVTSERFSAGEIQFARTSALDIRHEEAQKVQEHASPHQSVDRIPRARAESPHTDDDDEEERALLRSKRQAARRWLRSLSPKSDTVSIDEMQLERTSILRLVQDKELEYSLERSADFLTTRVLLQAPASAFDPDLTHEEQTPRFDLLDLDGDGHVDEQEFREYLSGLQSIRYGATVVRVNGLQLHAHGTSRPYGGINGDYQRSGELTNGRAVYLKIDKPTTAIWWANNDGRLCWCVGPKEQVGKAGMWAFVESTGFGPEEAGTRAWSVYSYNTQAWEEQTGVVVLNLDLLDEEACWSEAGFAPEAEVGTWENGVRGNPTPRGSKLVRVRGMMLHVRGQVTEYNGVNGDYQRSGETANGRAVYTKVNDVATAMWWANNDGRPGWCVGPKEQVGKAGMWAFVESTGFGPEEAGTRAWSVYSYNTQAWEEQTGVVVCDLDAVEGEGSIPNPLYSAMRLMTPKSSSSSVTPRAPQDAASAHEHDPLALQQPAQQLPSPRGARGAAAVGSATPRGRVSSARMSRGGVGVLSVAERIAEGALRGQMHSRPHTPRAPHVPALSTLGAAGAAGSPHKTASVEQEPEHMPPSMVTWWPGSTTRRQIEAGSMWLSPMGGGGEERKPAHLLQGGDGARGLREGSQPPSMVSCWPTAPRSPGEGGQPRKERSLPAPLVLAAEEEKEEEEEGLSSASSQHRKEAGKEGQADVRGGEGDWDSAGGVEEMYASLAANASIMFGAMLVRVKGVMLCRDGTSKPYEGVNGDYDRSRQVANGRAVYLHRRMPTAMWWANNDGKFSWCVGPLSQVGTDVMWGYVESMGFGPEEAGTRDWMVYSYNTHSWERQNSVEVRDIELQDQPVSEWEGLWPMTPLSGHSQQTPRAPLEEADDASFGFEPQHFGVGLHVTTNRIGAYVVKALDPHGPAQESGLVQIGDVLHSIDGHPMTGQGIETVRQLIGGEFATKVWLFFLTQNAKPDELLMDLSSFHNWRAVELVRTIPFKAVGSTMHTETLSKSGMPVHCPNSSPFLSQALSAEPAALEVGGVNLLSLTDTDVSGVVSDPAVPGSLGANQAVASSALVVRVAGVVLHIGGEAKPYNGVNGDYQRSQETSNGRPVYTKIGQPEICMWWTNEDGKASWCVGPKEQVGKTGMWAFVESTGFGPEEAGTRAWTAYSHDSEKWEEQTGVVVMSLDDNRQITYGPKLVRVRGVMLSILGQEKPYKAVNGVYQRSEEMMHGRAVYVKLNAPTTAMWWANKDGKPGWCIGPKDQKAELWTFAESTGLGPEEVGEQAWSVYSQDTQSWGEQTGVEVLDLETEQSNADVKYGVYAYEDEIVLDSEYRAYAANPTVRSGSKLVRVRGMMLHMNGRVWPYNGVNGKYERSQQVSNGRSVYINLYHRATAMWWANNDGRLCWCVGPKEQVGKAGMWAFVESTGFGPEEAGTRAWSVYSYNTQAWEEQTGVEVLDLDRTQHEWSPRYDSVDGVWPMPMETRRPGTAPVNAFENVAWKKPRDRPLSCMERKADKSLRAQVQSLSRSPAAPSYPPAINPSWPFGVGLKLTSDDDGVYFVAGLDPLSPAAECGHIQTGDVLHSIDGHHVTGLGIEEVRKLVAGLEESSIGLVFLTAAARPGDLFLDVKHFDRWWSVDLVRTRPFTASSDLTGTLSRPRTSDTTRDLPPEWPDPSATLSLALSGQAAELEVCDDINQAGLVGEGFVDEDEFNAFLAANRTVRLGAEFVRISGMMLLGKGDAKPYKGINGDYQRSQEVVNGRAVYIKVGKPTTGMWWANIDGRLCWGVGPKEQVGKAGMWAFVESTGFGPEEAGTRAWSVYSYNTQAWEEQTGVVVMSLDPPMPETFEEQGDVYRISVEFDLVLDMHLSDILGDQEEFKQGVLQDVVSAVGGQSDKMRVCGLEAGSVIVHIAFDDDIYGDLRSTLNAIRQLDRQAGDPGSILKQGRYTRHCVGIRMRKTTRNRLVPRRPEQAEYEIMPASPPVIGASKLVIDADSDGFIDEQEFSTYLQNCDGEFGASLVNIDGMVLYSEGSAQPYKGINGDYRRSDQFFNKRAVYTKVGSPAKAMWWSNIAGKLAWCVGPLDQLGGPGIWAYVESLGFGPEEAGTRAWMVFSYQSQTFEEQTGVEVKNLDPPELDVLEDVIEETENDDFDAAVKQAEARGRSVNNCSRPATGTQGRMSGTSRPPSSRSAAQRPQTANRSHPSSFIHTRPRTGGSIGHRPPLELRVEDAMIRSRPVSAIRSRPSSAIRSRPRTGSGFGSRPLTPLELTVEGALVQKVRSRPQTPIAPAMPAESDTRQKVVSADRTPQGSRPSTAQRLLAKQKAAAAAVAAEVQRLSGSRPDSGVASEKSEGSYRNAESAARDAAEKLLREEEAMLVKAREDERDRIQRWLEKANKQFGHKFPSSVTWRLPRKRGLAIDQGLWNTPWRMLQGADWRSPNSASIDLTVFRHSIYGTIIELKHVVGSGRSFVFKPTSAGNTPTNTPGNTPRHADKVKICRDDAYVADWRFNATALVQRMEAGEGSKLPGGPISFGCWNFEQTDPAKLCEEVFRKLDADGSGAMDADEVYNAAQIMGFADMSEENVKTWIKENDTDGNGLIDADEFKALIGVDHSLRNMKVTTSESSSELWLTKEGFVMLANDKKNESIICVGGVLLPYSVPKNTAWVHLGRADEAFKRTEHAAKEAAKKAAAEEARKLAEQEEELARTKKEREKQAKLERRRQREAEANGIALVPLS